MKKPKTSKKQQVAAAAIAKAWGLSPGRVSQLVRDGMPLNNLEDAREWRRSTWDISRSPLPDYLLERAERCCPQTLVGIHRVSLVGRKFHFIPIGSDTPRLASAFCRAVKSYS
ncbi:MAG: hypothetical protein WC076_12835 [Terrimicrobiaceae bacterium]